MLFRDGVLGFMEGGSVRAQGGAFRVGSLAPCDSMQHTI